jgi:hypothetical protein
MSVFEFVSHESYPEDQYTLESVVLCLEGKYRVTYVRKKMQSGAMYWDVISTAVKHNGDKKYLRSFSQDSNFLAEDIKHFLEKRSWEEGRSVYASEAPPVGVSHAATGDEVPF